ncbi:MULTISPECIES: hypothetical protein [Acetobacter]|uniref:Uncharacterized protein n=1 Tax=Acetobacter lovaniensis TaxID=104100 RepID=A0A841QDT9_9PROT|nr:hypothetical protein [Acetobacter lovaniensis]MBB6456568.1 hypothetical protein [Acetobacter lovaniensis]NHN80928.1 hypothetical protein [Acetobacter lovaniensis]GBQ62416.1 hypothetical protein AA0474_0005 [Acetobacter lovaniensis NRIC 0474]
MILPSVFHISATVARGPAFQNTMKQDASQIGHLDADLIAPFLQAAHHAPAGTHAAGTDWTVTV